MSRLARLCARQLGEMGFSIGIDDVTPSEDLSNQKHALVKLGYSRCDELIRQRNTGELKAQAGCDEDETLEAQLVLFFLCVLFQKSISKINSKIISK